jgi:ferritin-like metal-binding protein YciE
MAPAKQQDTPQADAKLVQYLTEAHGKEKELETALGLHIEIAQRDAYKKRLKQHLKETKQHSKQLERRIKKLGGQSALAQAAELVTDVSSRAVAAAKGPVEAVRGVSPEEKQLKNARTEFKEEHEEIAMYAAIQQLAESLGDKETAKLARSIRREEERMAAFLEKQIPLLTKEVVKAEIPAAERRARSSSPRRRSKSSRSSSSRASSSTSSSSRKRSGSTGSKRSSSSTSRKRSGSTTSKKASGATSRKRGGSTTSKKGSSSSRSGTRKRTTKSR